MNLYFSMKCKFSKQLISEIQKNENISNSMKAVCVDEESYPHNVTHVPTIEHDGKLFVGKQAFEYVASLGAPKELLGMELGTDFTFIENGTKNFRFDGGGGLASSDISDRQMNDVSSRFDVANGREPEKKSSNDLMDQLKAQRESEIPLPMKRV